MGFGLNLTTVNIRRERVIGIAAPSRETMRDSATMIERIGPAVNPSVRITATSVTRSRAAIAIVLAVIMIMIIRTSPPTPATIALMLPIISMNWAANSRSVMVSVGAEEFLVWASISSLSLGMSSSDRAFIQ